MAVTLVRIALLSRSSTAMASSDPVLLDGELAVADTGSSMPTVKIGDGTRHWSTLPALMSDAPDYVAGPTVTLPPGSPATVVIDNVANPPTISFGIPAGADGSASAGGADTDVQFKDGGKFAGDGRFTWSKVTGTQTTMGHVVITGAGANPSALQVTGEAGFAAAFFGAGAGSFAFQAYNGPSAITNNGAPLLLFNHAGASGYSTLQNDSAGNWSIGYTAGAGLALGTPIIKWNTSGNVVIPSPSAGTALTVTPFGAFAAIRAVPTTGTVAWSLAVDGSTNIASMFAAGGSLALGTAGGSLSMNPAGNVVIAQPTSGTSLALTGRSGAPTIAVDVSAGTNAIVISNGTPNLDISVGSSANGYAVMFGAGSTLSFGAAGTVDVTIAADHGLFMTGASGGSKGPGTINAIGLYVNGVSIASSLAANPTASVGLAVVNGVASTFMRSDAAPPLSQSITPTWTAKHIFHPAPADIAAVFFGTTASGPAVQVSAFAGSSGVSVDVSSGANALIASGGGTFQLALSTTPTGGGYLQQFGAGGTLSLGLGGLTDFAINTDHTATLGNRAFTSFLAHKVINTSTVNNDSAGIEIDSGSSTAYVLLANQNQTSGLFGGNAPGPQLAIINVGAYPITFATNNVQRMGIGAAGGVTIAAPSSGTGAALSVTALSGARCIQLTGVGAGIALGVTCGNTVGLYLDNTTQGVGKPALRIDVSSTTGSGTPTFANNKPTASSATAAWLPIMLNGTTYYIPCWL